MDGFLRTDLNSTIFPGSPTNSFLADEVASTCPLLTPSPPTNALVNPLPEPCEPDYTIGQELVSKLQHVKEDGDSASSSSSALAEPSCTQLLNNHINNYHHVIKDEDNSAQETNGKVQPVQLTFRNPPDNYFFMTWNWPIIRKVSLWLFLSGLVAMVALVIAMISTLPRKCNPVTEWYQGNVFYEIFPAKFLDTNNDGIGDLNGITEKVDYFESLGIKAVKLNSIFKTNDYPNDYTTVTNLNEIDPRLGTNDDFKRMSEKLHSKNMTLVLDLHVPSNMLKLPEFLHRNQTNFYNIDPISQALMYWLNYGVNGFYLKGIEMFAEDPNFGNYLKRWKNIIGPDRPLITNKKTFDLIPQKFKNIFLNHVDLIDVILDIQSGASKVSQQIDSILNSTLFTKAGAPWVLWSLSNDGTTRLVDRLPVGNATLGATLFQLMLPGTPSIFYGDEIGLKHSEMIWDDENNSDYNQIEAISKMISLRVESPAIYVNSMNKDGDNKATAEVKYSAKDLLVVQRWYPRRKSYVVVSNLGAKRISADLSTLLYSGQIVVAPQPDVVSESISFSDISLWPGESVVVILD